MAKYAMNAKQGIIKYHGVRYLFLLATTLLPELILLPLIATLALALASSLCHHFFAGTEQLLERTAALSPFLSKLTQLSSHSSWAHAENLYNHAPLSILCEDL